MTAPTLTGFAPAISLAENAVNATPALLDGDVVFADVEGDFNGGTLTLSGLLADDRASVRNEGTGAGQIGLSGSDVTFGGVVIGTLAGGVGTTLTITFNASATAEAIEALIQNLTYATVSDVPTASRTLTLNVTDAAGEHLSGAASGVASLTQLTGAANPFNGIDVGGSSIPTLVDIDGDGDQDLVVGASDGFLRTWRNGTDGTSGAFVQLNISNPVNFSIGNFTAPTFFDVDGDSDPDLVFGNNSGELLYYRNGSATATGSFSMQTGAASPFDGIDVGTFSTPIFADLDGDGDKDLIIGASDGMVRVWRNGTAGAAGAFEQLTGASNPFDGIDVGANSAPSFADIDGDGDQDLVLGQSTGTILVFRNGTATAAGAFTQVTGAANPLDGVDVGTQSAPAFGDFDGDGDLDAVVGAADGTIRTYENTTAGSRIVVDVTAGADTFNGTAGSDSLTGETDGDVLNGLDGDDTLGGGAGNQTLDGGSGVDTADFSDAAAAVSARLNSTVAASDGDGGSDTLISIENLTGSAFNDLLIGSGAANALTGGLGSDTLLGLGGNDILSGGTGASNTLQGGLGDDTYVVDANDTLIEFSGEGTDSVQTSRISYALRTHFENLLYTGSSAFSGTGNADHNTLVGGSGDDVLSGRGGVDTLNGSGGSDTADYGTAAGGVIASLAGGSATNDGDGSSDLFVQVENLTGSAFADTLTGDAQSNILTGGSGDDILAGRGGSDVLRGGAGTDTADYSGAAAGVSIKMVLKATSNDGDGGSDTFNSIENVIGSSFNDVIAGDGTANVLQGGLGSDTLLGLGGNDTLHGGTGAANQLHGGLGDDTYIVDANDTVVEFAAEGTDTVQTTRSTYNLAAHLENLTFTGTGAFTGRGNAEANTLTGGSGADFLTGGLGDDTLFGGFGLDTAVMSGSSFEYTIENLGGGQYRITDTVGGRDGVDILSDIEEVRFANGITGILGGGAPAPVLTDKDPGSPQVLPGLSDGDFLLDKDADMPLVLPGTGDDPVRLERDASDAAPLARWLMLSVDQDGPADHRPDGLVGLWGEGGWNRDDWSV